LRSKQANLSNNFEQKALNCNEEFSSLLSSPRHGHGPIDASHECQDGSINASSTSAKRSYQPTPLELVGSFLSIRQTSVSVSVATVATQVGVSSSISAKPRNPGQHQIIPAKHFGEYYGYDHGKKVGKNRSFKFGA
jgi:hypothetical protein